MSIAVEEIEAVDTDLLPMVLRLRPAVELSDDQLFELCRIDGELRIECNEQGDLIIMPPAGGESSNRNAEITMQITSWANRDGSGIAFDSSGGFRLGKRHALAECRVDSALSLEQAERERQKEVSADLPGTSSWRLPERDRPPRHASEKTAQVHRKRREAGSTDRSAEAEGPRISARPGRGGPGRTEDGFLRPDAARLHARPGEGLVTHITAPFAPAARSCRTPAAGPAWATST